MTLLAICLLVPLTLGAWLFPRRRLYILLALSIVALFELQSFGLRYVLPTATVLLVLGVWWITNPQPNQADWRTLIAIGLMTAIVPVVHFFSAAWQGSTLASLWPPHFAMDWGSLTHNFAFAVPMVIALVGGVVAVGSLVPERDDTARRRLAFGFIILIVLLFVVMKLPALQAATAGALSQSTAQPIPLDWQWFGFSYIAFRLLHVLLDFRNKRLKPVPLRDFALYVVFYPALPAGPIDRIEHFSRELSQSAVPSRETVIDGLTRIGFGLFKKFVLADSLAYFALSPILAQQTGGAFSFSSTWLMVYAYSFQIYLDFAGYTDIALGMARLAGITLPENFTSPYTKRNIQAFWNSWHITLSTWFRAYFFTPFTRALMQSPLKNRRLLIILLAQVGTMVLIGLWHGMTLNFVLWGLWHGVGLWLHRWIVDHNKRWDGYVAERPRLARAIGVLSVLTTFHFVAIGWVFFALPDLSLILTTLGRLVGLHV